MFPSNDKVIQCEYSVKGCVIHRSSTSYDVELIFNNKVYFVPYTNGLENLVSRFLGFIIRNSLEFSTNIPRLLPFKTYLRTKLEYARII